MGNEARVSSAFAGFQTQAPEHARAWMEMAQKLDSAGATRAKVLSAVLIGLPAVGIAPVQCLPAAIEAYDED
jgi:hypothetical protein